MLSSIGRSPRKEATELVAILLECHERIRRFAALAGAIGEHPELPASDIAEACDRVERYFARALPLHVTDEEQSIAPRLRGRSAEVDRALETMLADHLAHGPTLSALLSHCASLREHAEDAARRAAVGRLGAELAREFSSHLALEEAVVFPALQQLLSEAERVEIVGELRARRGTAG